VNASDLLGLDHNVGLLLVEADSRVFHFARQLCLLLLAFLSVEHHQDQVGRFADGYHLSASTLAVGSPLDDPWQVEQLQLGSVDEELTWDASQRREFVCSSLRLLLRHKVQKGGLAHGGESNHSDARASMLLNVEAFALGCGLGTFSRHRTQFRKLRLEQTKMILSCLILLRARVLELNLLDLLSDAHFLRLKINYTLQIKTFARRAQNQSIKLHFRVMKDFNN